MKKYCLTPTAKNQLTEVFTSTIIITGGASLILIIAFMILAPFMWGINITAITDMCILYIGTIGWIILIPLILIWVKRWLKASIHEC